MQHSIAQENTHMWRGENERKEEKKQQPFSLYDPLHLKRHISVKIQNLRRK